MNKKLLSLAALSLLVINASAAPGPIGKAQSSDSERNGNPASATKVSSASAQTEGSVIAPNAASTAATNAASVVTQNTDGTVATNPASTKFYGKTNAAGKAVSVNVSKEAHGSVAESMSSELSDE